MVVTVTIPHSILFKTGGDMSCHIDLHSYAYEDVSSVPAFRGGVVKFDFVSPEVIFATGGSSITFVVHRPMKAA